MDTSTVHLRFNLASGASFAVVIDDPSGSSPVVRCYRITRDGARESSRHVSCYRSDRPEHMALEGLLAHAVALAVDAMGGNGTRWEVLPRPSLSVLGRGR